MRTAIDLARKMMERQYTAERKKTFVLGLSTHEIALKLITRLIREKRRLKRNVSDIKDCAESIKED